MSLQVNVAHATAALTALTSSSGCTATFAAQAGVLLTLSKIIIHNGPALALSPGLVTITGLLTGTILLPIVQLLNDIRTMELDFSTLSSSGIPASGLNVAISASLPALLGGAETSIILIGVAF